MDGSIVRWLVYLLLCGWGTLAEAATSVDITKGSAAPLPVAISIFKADHHGKISREIHKVISSDLANCGLFAPISTSAFLEQLTVDSIPNYAHWRQLNAQVVLAGTITEEAGGLKISVKIWDPYGERELSSATYRSVESGWRRIAHKIADLIYRQMLGGSGMFDSRVLYIAESGPPTKRIKKLAIIDQDGANQKFLTDGRYMCLTPRFHPQSQRAIYMSYKNRVPQVYVLDINSGKQKLLGHFQGMSFAPRFSPDGESAALSIARRGSTNIYSINLTTGVLYQLTKEVGTINTSPSYAPRGDKIAFTSDRGGQPQIYVMNSDGSGVSRISYGSGTYSTPVWSPNGDYIAFTKFSGGLFYIGVMRPDGSGERLLTSSWLEEGPTWSPNGRVIMFSRQSGFGKHSKNQLYAIDITGYHERMIRTSTEASDPAWSSLL